MFKLHKHKSGIKSRNKFDFKFSSFQANQVPKGWDKLFVSFVSLETGKTIGKLGRASVRNGTCRWTETFSESVFIPQDNGDSKELETCVFKFVVAMGSSRSGILGEVSVNLADYTNSRTSIPLSLQLKKCNYGTTLQFKVQCLSEKRKHRDRQSKETDSDHDDVETKSDASDSAFSRSLGSTSSNHLESASASQAGFSREPSLSASDSRNSFDSIETSSGKDIYSPQNNLVGAANLIGRQDSVDSQKSGPSYSFRASNGDNNRSNHSSFHSRAPDMMSPYGHQREPNSSALVSSPFSTVGSSKNLLEAAEVTIEELRAEARLWERNAKNLTADIDVLKKEFSEQSRNQETLNMELSASHQECNGLKQEIEHLKSLLEESSNQQDRKEDLRLQARDMKELQQEMEEELGFLKESNANLTEQLQKTQDSNVELLSILQELEGIVETQKLEIESLSSQKKLEDSEKTFPTKASSATQMELTSDSDLQVNSKVVQTTEGLVPEGINDIKLQLQQLQETQEELENAILQLEKTVEEKDNDIEMERELRMQSLLESESKWTLKVAAKEEEIISLKAKLSEVIKNPRNKNTEVETGGERDLAKEVEFLRGKVEDLEKDCDELTQENMELLLKLREPRTDFLPSDPLVGSSCDNPDIKSSCTCATEVTELRAKIQELKQELSNKSLIEDAATSAQAQVQCQYLESKCRELEIELQSSKEKTVHLEDELQSSKEKIVHLEDELQKFHIRVQEQQSEVHTLQQQLLGHKNKENTIGQEMMKSDTVISADVTKELEGRASKVEALTSDHGKTEEEITVLKNQIFTLENQISCLRDENGMLQETIENLEKEKSISSDSFEELKKEITILHGSVESQVSASKVLERLKSELERGKEDVEQQLSDLEKENMQLSERISALEAQLRYLTNEKETCHLELRYSESQATHFRDEVRRLETEMEAQKVDMKQKLQDMKNRWLESQEECEYLKKANPKLQATAENLIEECTSLQKFNGELKRQNMELHSRCTMLESQVKVSHERFSECSQKLETLEAEFSMILEEVTLKEKSLQSELDSLIIDNREHKEKLMQENVLLNHMYSQKVVEVENIQKELAHLIDQISIPHAEEEAVTSDTMLELSILRADKAKLEAAVQELEAKPALSANKHRALEVECEAKMQELVASRQSQQALMADHDKLLIMLENFKSNEEKHKSIINGLEIKVKASDYERLQLGEEISIVKEQLQRASLLQDEVLTLKTSLNDAKFEHDRLKASWDLLLGDNEELKTEKESLVQKISIMEKTLSGLEDTQRSKIALEEKILRLEGDLAAREALCAQDAELKFELSRVKRANGELQRKIKHLEQDKNEYLKRAQALEEQLNQSNQGMQGKIKFENNTSGLDNESNVTTYSSADEKELVGVSRNENNDYMLKIQTLETELAEALEANDMYKSQLRRFLSDEENSSSDNSKLSTSVDGLDVKRNGSYMSPLEVELRDLREKYFQMSLKYAEVEAQREDLVMKLKSTNNRRRWFS